MLVQYPGIYAAAFLFLRLAVGTSSSSAVVDASSGGLRGVVARLRSERRLVPKNTRRRRRREYWQVPQQLLLVVVVHDVQRQLRRRRPHQAPPIAIAILEAPCPVEVLRIHSTAGGFDGTTYTYICRRASAMGRPDVGQLVYMGPARPCISSSCYCRSDLDCNTSHGAALG